MIKPPQYENKIDELFEFNKTTENIIQFRVMVAYHDETGAERKSSLGDGALKLDEFVGWAASTTEFDVPMIMQDKESGAFESAVLTIQLVWTPEEVPDDYEAPMFD